MIELMAEDATKWPEYRKERAAFQESLVQAIQTSQELPSKLGKLQEADVFLIFIESYGRAPFVKPSTRQKLEIAMSEMQSELEKNRFQTVSGYVYPSVSGGGSGFAHMEFLTGQRVANKLMFDEVLETDLRPLPQFFAASGYRCFNIQPAMTIDWNASQEFFGFTQNYFQHHIPYDGHEYFWGMMPDQFALQYFYEKELKNSKSPIFAMFVSVTSHAPFNTIPPYYEEWEDCQRPKAFSEGPAVEYEFDWSTYLSAPEIEGAYVETLIYSLRTCVGLAKRLTRPAMIMILGDHQPPRVGDLGSFDSSYAVPFHIISNVEDLLVPFVSVGQLEPGFVPSLEAPSAPAYQFFPAFVRLFGTE